MEISIVQQDLEHLDRLDSDTLLLFLPRNEAPFHGLPGLVDWRLTGRLSRYLARGWMSGERGERLLMPADGRLPVQRLLGIGIGEPADLDMVALESLAEMAGKALSDAKTPSVACALPGEPDSLEEIGGKLRVLRRGLARHYDGRLVLLGDAKKLRQALDEAS